MKRGLADRGKSGWGRFLLTLLLNSLLMLLPIRAQQAPQDAPQARETGAPFHLRSDLVLLRVIVRDSNGRTVDDLRQGDFQVFDSKKLQTISHFAVEAAVPDKAFGITPITKNESDRTTATTTNAESSKQYTALFFDDFHLRFENLAHEIQPRSSEPRLVTLSSSPAIHRNFRRQ